MLKSLMLILTFHFHHQLALMQSLSHPIGFDMGLKLGSYILIIVESVLIFFILKSVTAPKQVDCP